jgi:hypothetical protein
MELQSETLSVKYRERQRERERERERNRENPLKKRNYLSLKKSEEINQINLYHLNVHYMSSTEYHFY